MTVRSNEAEAMISAALEVKCECVFECETGSQPSEMEQSVIKLLNDSLFSAQKASYKEDRCENQMHLFHSLLR